MANVYTQVTSGAKGEERLARKLSACPDDRLHLWFSLSYLPGVRDIDVLIAHERIGFISVEIKAVPLRAIKSFSFNSCEIEGRSPDQGPVVQAHSASSSLREFLVSRMDPEPFISCTACWSEISRDQWNQGWDNPSVTGEYAQRMLFSDDFISGTEALITRLQYIHSNPPMRCGGRSRIINKETINKINELLCPKAMPKPTVTERDKLRRIETGVTAELRKKFPPGDVRRVLFRGYPGTGKTFRLLQIGSFHAYEGRRVLFVCFNKTLASDIRRLLHFSEKLRRSPHRIEAVDIFQLATHCFRANGLEAIDGDDADAWGRMVVDELKSRSKPSLGEYDTILVDESQDMQDWQLELIHLLTRTRTTLCLACGNGQELYRDHSSALEWLGRVSKGDLREEVLRTNFRNPRPQYYCAHAYFEAYPDKVDKVPSVRVALLGHKRSKEVLFERPEGSPAYLQYVDDSGVDAQSEQAEFMSAEYYDILLEQVEQIRNDVNAALVDLLVLVPDTDGPNAQWARSALEKMHSALSIDFIDYTIERNRRSAPSNDQVRLSTFHSARGLEGDRVVVFGFEIIGHLEDKIGVPAKNLGFIVLSRAVYHLIIAMRSCVSTDTRRLLEHILREYDRSAA